MIALKNHLIKEPTDMNMDMTSFHFNLSVDSTDLVGMR